MMSAVAFVGAGAHTALGGSFISRGAVSTRRRARSRFAPAPAAAPASAPARVQPRASLASDRPAFQDVNEAVIKAVERYRDRRVTPSDVAVASGLGVPEAETELARLAGLTSAAVDVTDAGDLAYRFIDVRSKLRNASLRASVRMAWERAWPYIFTGVRVGFGLLLIVSLVVTFLAIAALMAAGRRSDDDRSDGPSAGTFMLYRMFTPNIFDIIFYTRMQQRMDYYEASQRGAYPPEPEKMSFLESVYSFVFGDGNPNRDAEARQWKALAAVITANDGAVTAEQLRPFVLGAETPSSGGQGYLDESDVLPVLTRFGGRPEVTPDGDIVYVFPEFTSTGSARRVEFAGMAATHLSERTEDFSRSTGGQRAMTVALGVINVVGAFALGSMLAVTTPITPDAAALLNLIKTVYPAIAAYALTFVLVPLARFFFLRRRNSEVERRNEVRLRAAAQVAAPDRTLRDKLKSARDYRVERRVVAEKDVVFSSDMDATEVQRRREQELADEFDRRIGGR